MLPEIITNAIPPSSTKSNLLKANEFKIKVTHTIKNISFIITLADLQGYEGEDSGVFIHYDVVPKELCNEWLKVSNKSGYDDSFINWDKLKFEFVP